MGLFRSITATRILRVCTAYICRSPMAEGLLREELRLRSRLDEVCVSSAGPHVSMPGQPADARAQRVCAREGIDLRKCRARQVTESDFRKFSYILAMDRKNLEWLHEYSPAAYRGRIYTMGSWSAVDPDADIPDPYFGSLSGFDDVLARLRPCVTGFLDALQAMERPGRD